MKRIEESSRLKRAMLRVSGDLNKDQLNDVLSDKTYINGVEYKKDEVSKKYKPLVKDALLNTPSNLKSDTENKLDVVLQFKTFNRLLYAIVQAFSILSTVAIGNTFKMINLSTKTQVPWYIFVLGSLFAGHIGTKLATYSIKRDQKRVEHFKNPIANYFSRRFGKALIAFQAGGIATIINLLIVGSAYIFF